MARTHNVVMDGRDIGTVIMPDAQVKIFLCANENARAKRRYLELTEKGVVTTLEAVENEMNQRDRNEFDKKDRSGCSLRRTPLYSTIPTLTARERSRRRLR